MKHRPFWESCKKSRTLFVTGRINRLHQELDFGVEVEVEETTASRRSDICLQVRFQEPWARSWSTLWSQAARRAGSRARARERSTAATKPAAPSAISTSPSSP